MMRRTVAAGSSSAAMSDDVDRNSSLSSSSSSATFTTAKHLIDFYDAPVRLSEEEIQNDFQTLVSVMNTKASAVSSDGTKKLTTEASEAYTTVVGAGDGEVPFKTLDESTCKIKTNSELSQKVYASLGCNAKSFDQMQLEERLKHTLTTAVKLSQCDNVKSRDIDRMVKNSITWASDLRAHMPFYGHPGQDQAAQPFDFTGSVSQPSLKSAYEGPNEMLTSWFILELIMENSWHMKIGLPLRRSDNLAGEVYEQIIFNPTMFDRVPLLGTSSYMTSRTASRKILQVRYGKSAEMEFSFSRTEKGRIFWSLQQIQMRNALMATIAFGIAIAIMGCKQSNNATFDSNLGPYGKGLDSKKASLSRAAYETRMKMDHVAWDCINKVDNPLDRIVERGLATIQAQCKEFSGGEMVNVKASDVTASFPDGAARVLRQSNLHNNPSATGMPRQRVFEQNDVDGMTTAPGGYRVVQSRMFKGQGETIDPQFSTQTIGYWSWIPGAADWEDDLIRDSGSMDAVGVLHPSRAVGAAGQIAGGGALNQQVPMSIGHASGIAAYRTTKCNMDSWKADSDDLRQDSYAEAFRAMQWYESPVTNARRGGGGAAGNSQPRRLTRIGRAVMMHYHGQNHASLNKWFASGNEEDDAEHVTAAKQRWVDAQNHNHAHAHLSTPLQFWGQARLGVMTKALLYAIDRYYSEDRFRRALVSIPTDPTATIPQTFQGVNGRFSPFAANNNTPTWTDIVALRDNASTWMQGVSLENSAFMDFCLDYDIPLFIQINKVTPFAQYHVGATIVFRSTTAPMNGIGGTGGGIGETVYGNPQYRIAFNANPGHYVAQMNIWFKSFVRNPQYVSIDTLSFVQHYIRGDNGEYFTTKDHQNNSAGAYQDAQSQWQNNPESMHTAYAIGLPPGAKLFTKHDHFDISGNYHTNGCALNTKTPSVHYCTAPFYAPYWTFRAVDSVGKQDATFSVRYGNSAVSRNYSCRRDGLYAGGRREVWHCKGHWSADLEPNYLTTRMDTSIRAQQRQRDSTVIIKTA